eukprot:gene7318-9325_t
MESAQNKSASTLMVVLAYATVYIVWGSTYFFIQKALAGFHPFLLGALRFIAAGVIVLFSERVIGAFSTIQNKSELAGLAMLVIGSMCWAGGSLYSKYKTTSGSIM